MGDASDNIPGVPGIGEKTALELIRKYGSIEEIYNNLDSIEKNSIRQKLNDNRELAFMSKKLATIERNMPELCTMEDLKRKGFNDQALYELFKRLEFKSLIERFNLEKARKVTQETEKINVEVIDSPLAFTGLVHELSSSEEGFSMYHLIDKYDIHESRLIGAGIAWGKDKQAYIDLSGGLDEETFIEGIKPLLEDDRVRKYGHDAKSLMVYLKNRNVSLKGLAFDTMIGAYVINPTRPAYTVSELADEYLNLSVEPIEELSGKGKNFTFFRDMPKETLSRVAAMHARAILMIKDKLDQVIRENGQEELFYGIELPLSEVLADMEHHGFKVDVDGLREFSSELDLRLESLEREIYQLAGERFNINSTKQLGALLFEKLKLPVIKKTKTGYSTDADVLEELSPMHPIIPRILEYRQLMKLKSTYAEGLINMINPETGKIHSSFNQTVTATGRISSTEPNLQNIPIKLELGRKIRRVFIPSSDEYILLDADYSQIELRVLAHITGDEHMIAAFENNEDIHASTAAKVFGVSKDQVTPLMRSRAKAINFGIVYGIGDFSLSRDLGITRKEARRYIDEYLNTYPKVRQYMHDIVEQGKTFGFVTTLFNRRRYLPELKSRNFNTRAFGERVALNTPIQGSAADIIKIAMVKVYRELKRRKLRSRLILQVHDELIIEAHKDEKEEVEHILADSMENAVKLRVPLRVDVKSGSNWYETK